MVYEAENEITQIMTFLGRGYQDGEVRGSHLGQILMYLKQRKTETMKNTLAKLALICGTSKRNLRENYLEGMEAFGIIRVRSEGNTIIWTWIGVKVFENEPNITPLTPPRKRRGGQ